MISVMVTRVGAGRFPISHQLTWSTPTSYNIFIMEIAVNNFQSIYNFREYMLKQLNNNKPKFSVLLSTLCHVATKLIVKSYGIL